METTLFALGIFIFMITVYGAVMAGGAVLKQHQVEHLADDVEFTVNDDGYEVVAGADSDANAGRESSASRYPGRP